MKNDLRKVLMVLAMSFFLVITAFTQTAQDAVYAQFTRAYKSLDSKAITDLYTQNAVVTNLYRHDAPSTIVGSLEISAYFKSFFEQFDPRNQQLELVFKVSQRRKIGNEYFDNGFYRLIIFKNKDIIQTLYGKFATIIVQENGKWKFRSDATSDADPDEFN
jgi:ketosteroid isomerase-like protein